MDNRSEREQALEAMKDSITSSGLSRREIRQIADKIRAEEMADRAATLEAKLGNGFKVFAHEAWKGYGMTLVLPERKS